MSLEDFPNWIYTIFLAPLGFAMHKIMNHGNRLSILETQQKNLDSKINRICQSNEELAKEVHTLIGKLEGHLKRD